PAVTAMPSRSPSAMPASLAARRRTGTIVATCWRDATSGTTPPYTAWTLICDATTSERTQRPSSTTDAAVSSQEVSMPRTSMRQQGDRLGRLRARLHRQRTGGGRVLHATGVEGRLADGQELRRLVGGGGPLASGGSGGAARGRLGGRRRDLFGGRRRGSGKLG